MKVNARFWIMHRGDYVKLTLAPGQSLSTFEGSAHEEGWSSTERTFSFDGAIVTRESCHDGRDCDGRLTNYETAICHVLHLQAWPSTSDAPAPFPAWETLNEHQRDYAAERMGY